MPVKFLVVVCVVLLIALLGAAGRTAGKKLPRRFGDVLDSGILFLLVGALLGPSVLNLITPDYLDQLGPVVVVALSWIGFFFGFNLQWRWLKKFDAALYLLTLVEALTTFCLVAAVMLVLLPRFIGNDTGTASLSAAVAVLAAAASGTAPASLFLLAGRRSQARLTLRTVRFVAVLDDLPGLLAIGMLFSFAHRYSATGLSPLVGWQWLVLSIVLGVAFGLLAASLVPAYREEQKLGLVILGILALCGGICAYLNLSPLFVSAVAGVTFSNVSMHRERVYSGLAPREHAIYVFFLVLVGCLWLSNVLYLGLALFYVFSRAAGKLVGAALGSVFLRSTGPDPRLGLILLPQGGLAIAMAVDYQRTYGTPALPGIVTMVIIAVVVSELIGPALASRELRRRGEI